MTSQKGSVFFVASVYNHLRAFHVPYMRLLSGWGYDVFAVAAQGYAVDARVELESLGFQCIDVPFERTPFSKSTIVVYKRLRSLLSDKEDVKLIHVHTPTAAFLTRKAEASVAFNGVILYTAHGFHFYQGASLKNWLIYYLAEKHAAKFTDGLITINREDYEVARRFRLRAGGHVYYVPGVGVDLSVYYPVREEERQQIRTSLCVNSDDVVFVYVGEINHNKNQRQFLYAFREAFSSGDVSARAWIVGDGPQRAEMETLASQLGIDNRVSFLGKRNDVPELLRGADVGVLLSYREGLPRCLMEVSATGIPVIATDIRGNRDIVKDNETGILVDIGSVEATATAMRKLAMDPHVRRSMGARALGRARMFSLDEVMSQMTQIYRQWLRE